MRLKNKISVITGGSRGIGAATVKRFVEEGSKVYIFDILDSEGAELANQLDKENFFVKFMKVNIKNEWGRIKNTLNKFSKETVTRAEYYRDHLSVPITDILSLWRGLRAGIENLLHIVKQKK